VNHGKNNLGNLMGISIWAFHGKQDQTIPFEETEKMMDLLKGKNKNIKFTADPDAGHSILWSVYPNNELYEWFLRYSK
jgi:dipeptidyl aminopeptidase/acylaminoacyl peptidase